MIHDALPVEWHSYTFSLPSDVLLPLESLGIYAQNAPNVDLISERCRLYITPEDFAWLQAALPQDTPPAPYDTPVDLAVIPTYQNNHTGEKSHGFLVNGVTAVKNQDETVTFTLSFTTTENFDLTAFEPPGEQFFLQTKITPEDTEASFTVPLLVLEEIAGITYKFYQHGTGNEGYVYLNTADVMNTLY